MEASCTPPADQKIMSEKFTISVLSVLLAVMLNPSREVITVETDLFRNDPRKHAEMFRNFMNRIKMHYLLKKKAIASIWHKKITNSVYAV